MTTMMDKLVAASGSELERQAKTGFGAWVSEDHVSPDKSYPLVSGTIDMRALIRAILTALKEPTEEMVAAAPCETAEDGQKYLGGLIPVWQAMIEEAGK